MDESQQLATDVLWRRYTGTRLQSQRNDLVVRYSTLVNLVVRRVVAGLPRNVEPADLVGHGVFGLIDAVEKFDPGRGYRFETYAVPRIKGAVLDGLRAGDWVPRSVRAKARLVDRAYHDLEGTLRRTPSHLEVAADLGMSELALHKILTQISSGALVGLDEPVSAGRREGRVALVQTLADPEQGPVALVEVEETRRVLRRAINGLGERDRAVLALYYYGGLTLAEIGRTLGVTESRVCQIHTRTLVKLRGRLDLAERECA